ncbi:MAG: phenylalanine--tRNA ligase subunit alpha [Candidatus Firestonebacteria bacterium]
MEKELGVLSSEIKLKIKDANTNADLDAIRVKYFGKKGIVTSFFDKLSSLPKEEKPRAGALLNTLRKEAEAALTLRSEDFSSATELAFQDNTLPGYAFNTGKYHPLSRIANEAKEIFQSMNFQILEGPEIETDYYNFEALNFPPHHPARDMQNSFHFADGRLLRTHTSPVQIRTMERQKPPLRMISIGKCYRSDPIDATHTPMFHQLEFLMIDTDINFGDLKGILKIFFSRLFEKEVTIRFNPSYFPFTEPSVEVSFSCFVCGGKGCGVCKKSGWIELGGAGMVDPNVFKSVGYDSEKWTGFAFGGGIERMAMLKYGINDIRLFTENDKRFLNQF